VPFFHGPNDVDVRGPILASPRNRIPFPECPCATLADRDFRSQTCTFVLSSRDPENRAKKTDWTGHGEVARSRVPKRAERGESRTSGAGMLPSQLDRCTAHCCDWWRNAPLSQGRSSHSTGGRMTRHTGLPPNAHIRHPCPAWCSAWRGTWSKDGPISTSTTAHG
jgi:hypothetical protein